MTASMLAMLACNAAVIGSSAGHRFSALASMTTRSACIRRGKDEKQLGLTYHGGPSAPLAADRTATPGVGDHAPNADVVDADGNRVRLFGTYRGPHFTAVAYGAYAVDALAKLDWPADGARLNRVIIDTDSKSDIPGGVFTDPTGQFAEIYGLSRDTLLLIRPDGYIGLIAIHNIAEKISAAAQSMTPRIVTSAPSKQP